MSTPVNKENLDNAQMLWIRENAHEIDAKAFKQSGLRFEQQNHPAVLVSTFDNQPDGVLVAYVSCEFSNRPLSTQPYKCIFVY